jgi:hypothetical protein
MKEFKKVWACVFQSGTAMRRKVMQLPVFELIIMPLQTLKITLAHCWISSGPIFDTLNSSLSFTTVTFTIFAHSNLCR